ncbi:MAG TPA: amidase [Sphingobium sp.]
MSAAPLDPTGAFLPYPPVPVAAAPDGPLSGLRFAVKDLMDVAGYPTGGGHPLMLAMHPCADGHAEAVARLLDAGCSFVGKTHTDELAWSLFGANPHFGTPRNPAAPDRLPGGSSSGSAVAVAAGLADLALGTDTGGSVRVPASFCGLWGLRPSHGRVSLNGALPLAPSFDTCGWFARDAETLARVAPVLLDGGAVAPATPRLLIAQDMLALCDEATQAMVAAALARLPERPGVVDLYREPVEQLSAAFATLQATEALAVHGEWIAQRRPLLSPAVARRFARAATITAAQRIEATALRQRYTQSLVEHLGPDAMVIAPIVPGEAPLLDISGAAADAMRGRMIDLLCVAGLTGRPQIAFPLGHGPHGAPIGLSLIGAPGSDEQLIDAAARLATALEKA